MRKFRVGDIVRLDGLDGRVVKVTELYNVLCPQWDSPRVYIDGRELTLVRKPKKGGAK